MRHARCLGLLLAAAGGLAAQADVTALVERLGSADARERSDAYSELQRTRPPEAAALLGKRISSFPLAGQSLAVYLLQQYPIDDTRAIYRRLLQDGSAFLRAAAAAGLYRAGDGDAAAPLGAAIAAAKEQELDLVLNRLYGIDAPAVAEAVRGWLRAGTPATAVEGALYHLLTQVKGRDLATQRAAEALLASADVRVRAAAAAYLVAVGVGEHDAALAEALRQQPQQLPSLQRFLDRAAHLDEVVLDALADQLAAAKSQIDVTYPARILQKHAAGRATASLRQLLGSDNEAVRTAALQALSAIPGGLSPGLLREMLASGVDKQVLVAAETMRRMDDLSGFDAVLGLWRGGKQKAEAVRVLGGFRLRAAVVPLLDALGDADVQVRRNAWYALLQLLPDLFPYRRFDLPQTGYLPDAAAEARAAGITALRAWWAARK